MTNLSVMTCNLKNWQSTIFYEGDILFDISPIYLTVASFLVERMSYGTGVPWNMLFGNAELVQALLFIAQSMKTRNRT